MCTIAVFFSLWLYLNCCSGRFKVFPVNLKQWPRVFENSKSSPVFIHKINASVSVCFSSPRFSLRVSWKFSLVCLVSKRRKHIQAIKTFFLFQSKQANQFPFFKNPSRNNPEDLLVTLYTQCSLYVYIIVTLTSMKMRWVMQTVYPCSLLSDWLFY